MPVEKTFVPSPSVQPVGAEPPPVALEFHTIVGPLVQFKPESVMKKAFEVASWPETPVPIS
jgi:hypothetical protein